jgi:hypothetical protein
MSCDVCVTSLRDRIGNFISRIIMPPLTLHKTSSVWPSELTQKINNSSMSCYLLYAIAVIVITLLTCYAVLVDEPVKSAYKLKQACPWRTSGLFHPAETL